MSTFVKFNVNSYVYVALSDKGKEVLDSYIARYYGNIVEKDYPILKKHNGRYHRFQMWEFMNIFGAETYLGKESLFEATVLLEKDDLK